MPITAGMTKVLAVWAAWGLKVIGMPATILLIDADGKEIGRLIGPAEWDSPEAKKLIEAQL